MAERTPSDAIVLDTEGLELPTITAPVAALLCRLIRRAEAMDREAEAA